MKGEVRKKIRFSLLFSLIFLVACTEVADPVKADEIPVKGMVTMVDLGATSCIPCKMMAPILQKLEKEYQGKAAIVFLDVWKDKAPARRFGVRAIPTQIFFDKDGNEVYRHVGFMSENAIVTQLKNMGVN
jgi:thioredoxin 1